MRVVTTISRLLLGFAFAFFGANGFLNFLHAPPPPGLAGQFMGAMVSSHYAVVVFGTQLIGGLLLLSGRYVPLGLALLAPVIVNILAFHATMAPAQFGPAVIVTILWIIVAVDARAHFHPLFEPKIRRAR